MQSNAQTVIAADSYVRSQRAITPGLCDHYNAVYRGLTHSGFGTAAVHFHATPSQYRHGTGVAPGHGELHFWTGGGSGAGHVATGTLPGMIDSTDFPKTGRVGRVPVGAISTHWGLTYVGWTDAWFGSQGVVLVTNTPPPPHPHPVPPPPPLPLEEDMTTLVQGYPGYVPEAVFQVWIDPADRKVKCAWVQSPTELHQLQAAGATFHPVTPATLATIPIIGTTPPKA